MCDSSLEHRAEGQVENGDKTYDILRCRSKLLLWLHTKYKQTLLIPNARGSLMYSKANAEGARIARHEGDGLETLTYGLIGLAALPLAET